MEGKDMEIEFLKSQNEKLSKENDLYRQQLEEKQEDIEQKNKTIANYEVHIKKIEEEKQRLMDECVELRKKVLELSPDDYANSISIISNISKTVQKNSEERQNKDIQLEMSNSQILLKQGRMAWVEATPDAKQGQKPPNFTEEEASQRLSFLQSQLQNTQGTINEESQTEQENLIQQQQGRPSMIFKNKSNFTIQEPSNPEIKINGSFQQANSTEQVDEKEESISGKQEEQEQEQEKYKYQTPSRMQSNMNSLLASQIRQTQTGDREFDRLSNMMRVIPSHIYNTELYSNKQRNSSCFQTKSPCLYQELQGCVTEKNLSRVSGINQQSSIGGFQRSSVVVFCKKKLNQEFETVENTNPLLETTESRKPQKQDLIPIDEVQSFHSQSFNNTLRSEGMSSIGNNNSSSQNGSSSLAFGKQQQMMLEKSMQDVHVEPFSVIAERESQRDQDEGQEQAEEEKQIIEQNEGGQTGQPEQVVQEQEEIVKPGQQLFEDFFVLGPDVEQCCQEYRSESKQSTVSSSILHHFPENIDISQDATKQTFKDYIYPNEVKFFEYKKKTQEETEDFILKKLVHQTGKSFWNQDCFVINMRGELQQSDEGIPQILRDSNPDLYQFLVCYKFHDYLCLDDIQQKAPTVAPPASNSSSSSNGNNNNSGAREDDGKNKEEEETINIMNTILGISKAPKHKKPFLVTTRVYCFATYYPFFEYFTQTVANIENVLKENRCIIHNGDNRNLKNVDLRKSLQIIRENEYIKNILKEQKKQRFEFGGSLKLYSSKMQEYQYTNIQWQSLKTFSNYLTAGVAFQNVSFDHFTLLFFSMVLEKHVIIFSQNLHVLTSIVISLFMLLRPILYPMPVITSCPDYLLETISCPPPILIGCNDQMMNLQDIDPNIDPDDYVCYDADKSEKEKDKALKITPETKKYIKDLIPKFWKKNSSLKQMYEKINNLQKKNIENSKKEFNQVQRQIEEITVEILNKSYQLFKKNIVDLIPKTFYTSDRQPDYRKIKKFMKEKNKDNSNFIDKFCDEQTQTYTYLVESFYQS